MIVINTRSFLFQDLEGHNHDYKLSWRQIMAPAAICHRYVEDVKRNGLKYTKFCFFRL